VSTNLIIGSIEVPLESRGAFNQEYEDINGQTFRRTADGSGVLRSLWTGKVRTLISGDGWAPSAFENIDAGTTHVIKCAMTRAASSATTSVTLPAARRSDAGHTPIGFALVDDTLVETPITGIVANVATLTAVAGADGYRVHYFPEITAVILRNTCKGAFDARFTWQIEAEQL